MDCRASNKSRYLTSFFASAIKTKTAKQTCISGQGGEQKCNKNSIARTPNSTQTQQYKNKQNRRDDVDSSPTKKSKGYDKEDCAVDSLKSKQVNVKLHFDDPVNATIQFIKGGKELLNVSRAVAPVEIEDDNDETILERDVGDLCETILEEVSNVDLQNELTANAIVEVDNDDNDSYKHWEIIHFIWKSVAGDPCRKNLLSPADFCILNTLFNMPENGQEVIFRLYTRQKKWYQLDKFLKIIKLDRHKALDLTLDDMEKFGYISLDIHHETTLEDILNFLMMPDLRKLVKEFRIKSAKTAKRNDLILALMNYVQSQRTLSSISLSDRVKATAIKMFGKCICLANTLRLTLFRLHVAYHFELTELTSTHDVYSYIHDIRSRQTVLPQFTVQDQDAFANCTDFYKYAEAIAFYFKYQTLKKRPKSKVHDKLLEIAIKVYDKLKDPIINDDSGSKFTPAYVYAKILSIAVSDLTNERKYVLEWLDFLLDHEYCTSRCGEWYVELAKHQSAEHDFEATKETCFGGLADKRINEIDKYNLLQKLHELKTRKKIAIENVILELPAIEDIPVQTISARPLEGTKAGHRVLYKDDDALQTVEKIAANYYTHTQLYPKYIHCEGSLVTTLFTIFFWDIIYQNVGNAFTNSMQYIPLDMFSKDFYINRRKEVNMRIHDIDEGWTNEFLFQYLARWKIQHAHEKGLHSMDLVANFQLIAECVKCITRSKLAKIFTRFVMNIKLYKAGMPDLFLWDPTEQRCMFVEVKSQNDTLSMKQKAWLCFLQKIGIPVQICLVNSVGARKYRTTVK